VVVEVVVIGVSTLERRSATHASTAAPTVAGPPVASQPPLLSAR
jgi:hypothetical protein